MTRHVETTEQEPTSVIQSLVNASLHDHHRMSTFSVDSFGGIISIFVTWDGNLSWGNVVLEEVVLQTDFS